MKSIKRHGYIKRLVKFGKLEVDPDLLLSDDSGHSESLGVAMPELPVPVVVVRTVHLEVTLTHPLTASWVNSSTTKQRTWFMKIWNNIKNTNGIPLKSGFELEYHKNGMVHLHGYLQYDISTLKGCVEGLLLDLSRSYVRNLPKRYSNINLRYLYSEQQNYTSPSIKVAYVDDQATPNRFPTWLEYISKMVDKNFGEK